MRGTSRLPRRRCAQWRSAAAALAAAAVLRSAVTVFLAGGPAGGRTEARTQARQGRHPVETVDLSISNPALLLNQIAESYASTSRILMEFVDNAFDDAEALYDYGAKAYRRPVRIDVILSGESNTSVKITDNCRGMAPEVLRRVTTNVGESNKRGQSFLNGQFGFGMQAFRACCGRLRVRSRSQYGSLCAPAFEILVGRGQSVGFEILEMGDGGAPGFPETGTGTEVTLLDIDEQWASKDALSLDAIADEIEAHFERLLSRENLTVTVRDSAKPDPPRTCLPLDYAARGARVIVDEQIPLGDGQVAEIMLAVAPYREAEEFQRQARFFAKGRRIGPTKEVVSFAGMSQNRWKVWSNPQVVGYIDVIGDSDVPGTGPLCPVITRDEFKNTMKRTSAYRDILLASEGPLIDALENMNARTADEALETLENVLSDVLSSVTKEDYQKHKWDPPAPLAQRRDPGAGDVDGIPEPPAPKESEKPEEIAQDTDPDQPEPSDDESDEPDEPKPQKEPKPRRLRSRLEMFKVQLVRELPTFREEQAQAADRPRSALVGNTIMVDVTHPDFLSRCSTTRVGAPKANDRLSGYLANEIASHYQLVSYEVFSNRPEDIDQAYRDMVQVACRLEERLRKELPSVVNDLPSVVEIGEYSKPGKEAEERALADAEKAERLLEEEAIASASEALHESLTRK